MEICEYCSAENDVEDMVRNLCKPCHDSLNGETIPEED